MVILLSHVSGVKSQKWFSLDRASFFLGSWDKFYFIFCFFQFPSHPLDCGSFTSSKPAMADGVFSIIVSLWHNSPVPLLTLKNLPNGASLVAQRIKHLPAMQETWVRSLGWEDPLEKEMATHSSILAWRIPWTEEPGGLQSMGSQRVGQDWVTSHFPFHPCMV